MFEGTVDYEGVNDLSKVSNLIDEHLQGQTIDTLPDGFRFALPEGHTDLLFETVQAEKDEWGLCEIATVVTSFKEGRYDFTPEAIAFLNRRAAFGNYFVQDGVAKVKQTISIYETDPAYQWISRVLLTALGSQLPFAMGHISSEASDEQFRANRANLEFPKIWKTSPTTESFELAAERFFGQGHISTAGEGGITLEIPLSKNSASSRIFDPEAETALLRVSADVPHPLAGVGYLSTIALPQDPPVTEIVNIANTLNSSEHQQIDFVPRLGAWGIRGVGNELVYSMFWATSEGDSGFPIMAMNWMVQRTFWLRDNFWIPEVGLRAEAVRQ